MSFRTFWESTGLLVAVTIGAGVFALPYLFAQSGWLVGFLYLGVLAALIIFAHILFAQVIRKTGDHHHVVGLANIYFGRFGFWVAFCAVLSDLLLSLVAYLILATRFANVLLPATSASMVFFGFWFLATLPLTLTLRRLVDLEFGGTITKAVLILALVIFSPNLFAAFHLPPVHLERLASPFGPILFALAGWTAIPPMYDFMKRSGRRGLFGPIILGTVIAALLYGIFALDILGFTDQPSPDTISGFANTPVVAGAIALLGLFAIWTAYISLALEVKNSLERDLHWKKTASLAAVFSLPPALIFLGFKSFLTVIGLVGGVFLSAQYALIMLIARKALRPTGIKRFALDLVMLAFALAALYEVYTFIVK